MAGIDAKEIDELLNLAMNGDNAEEESENAGKISAADKVYKKQKYPAARYRFPYKSPVIKSNDVIYNPQFDTADSKRGIVVRNLENYSNYVSNIK